MPNYKKMYLLLFNAITDALEELKTGNLSGAEALLKAAQQNAEEVYIRDKESSV
ncbi:MAG: hypothetical protein ACI3W7_05705 [Oscillospiraceae bacterium]